MLEIGKILETKGINPKEYEKTLFAIQTLPEELNRKLRSYAKSMMFLMGHVHPEDTALFYEFCRKKGLKLGEDFAFYYVAEDDHHMNLYIRRGLEHIAKAFEEFLAEIAKFEGAIFILRSLGITNPTKKQLKTAFEILEFQRSPCETCCRNPLKQKVTDPFKILKMVFKALPIEIGYKYGEKTVTVTVKYSCGHTKTKTFDFKEGLDE